MNNRDYIFEQVIGGLEQSMQATLRMMYSHMKMYDEIEKRREREQLKREIMSEIVANIKATVDISEVIQEIDELRKAIDSLGR